MTRRIGGDRRVRGRFEIVGTLSGTLELVERLTLRNVGQGGALVESKVPLPVGSRITGRLSLDGQTREVKAEVRHLTAYRPRGGGGEERHLVGVEWVDIPAPIDVLRRNASGSGKEQQSPVPDRRRAGRIAIRDGSEIQRPTWTTVELIDISTAGVLFVAPQEIAVGERGQLRMRFGEKGFVAEIEVRRSDRRGLTAHGCRIGAIFTALDDVQLATLDAFIGTARR